MPRLLMLVLALILSQGWQWSRLLQEQQQITGDQGLVLAASFTVLFLLQQWLLQIKQPVERSLVRDRSAVVELFLRQLLDDYYEIVLDRLGDDIKQPIVRVNVMLPVVDRLGFRRRLQICYKCCPDGVDYGAEEQDLFWTAENGVIGWVWSRCASQIYSESRAGARGVARSASHRQVVTLAGVRSAFSVPILLTGKPIAVLTLDGKHDLDRTLFDCEQVQRLVNAYAARLTSQCCALGVKPR
jgi:hypothetical protein